MPVYLATSGEHDDFAVQAVFTNRADAEAYELADDVIEHEVHDGPIEVRTWHELRWHSWQGDMEEAPGKQVANPAEYTSRVPFRGDPEEVVHTWEPFGKQFPDDWLVLVVKGWDLDAVRRVYSEQRNQRRNGQET